MKRKSKKPTPVAQTGAPVKPETPLYRLVEAVAGAIAANQSRSCSTANPLAKDHSPSKPTEEKLDAVE